MAEGGKTRFVRENLTSTMPDGIALATEVWRPAAEGKYPVLLCRGPYGNVVDPMYDPEGLASRGYVVVFQHCRGRYGSEGTFVPLHQEPGDGAATIEWLTLQPWSNGRVGMIGASYMGITQWLAATGHPPGLVTILPSTTADGFFGGFPFHAPHVLNLRTLVTWAATMGRDYCRRQGIDSVLGEFPDLRELLALFFSEGAEALGVQLASARQRILEPIWSARPLREQEDLTSAAPWVASWLDHPTPTDPFWEPIEWSRRFGDLHLPMIHATGWFDLFLGGAIRNFVGMSRSGPDGRPRPVQKLIIGPWHHGTVPTAQLGMGGPDVEQVGEMHFGPDAVAPGGRIEFERWIDHWLKQEPTGLEKEPPVRLFVMGDNVWRDEWTWPLERAKVTRYYLHSSGLAATRPADGLLSTAPPTEEPPDRFESDPANPVPSVGGPSIDLVPMAGPFDQSVIEGRPDVVTYTTSSLAARVEVTGPVFVDLWVGSSSANTDFVARLVVVRRDGKALNLCEGITRLRGGPDREEPVRIEIDLAATSYAFLPGERIRLDISSSNFPQVDVNPNDGSPSWASSSPGRVARQSIWHEPARPSCLFLPIIPD